MHSKFIRRRLLALIALCCCVAPTWADNADRDFEHQFGKSFLNEYWHMYPDAAINEGYYQVADRVLVPNKKARAAELAFLDASQARLHKINRHALSIGNRTDWALLDNEFASRRWQLNDERAWEWDPSVYNIAGPLAILAHANYAPLERRLQEIAKRLQSVPAYYAAAKKDIKNPTREHTQLAIEQSEGAISVLNDDVQKQLAASKLSSQVKASIAKRIASARDAVNDYIAWLKILDTSLAHGNARSFRIGREMYDKKFAYDIQSGDTPQALYARAVREKEQLHLRMSMLADELWPKYFPNTAPPADRLDKIGALIDKLSEQHVSRENYFAKVQQLLPEMSAWVTTHRLLDLDLSKPLEVRATPLQERGIAMASVDAPGPYDVGAPTYFNVTPIDDLSLQRAESFLREYNRWMLPILVIHEAIPGHYTQLVYANKSPSRIKAIFGNGAMIEGWAVYGERMMLESGYGDDTAEMWLIYSKWNLRSVCNTILDYSVHVNNMSEADAKRFLTHEAFQSAEEANGKWRRVQLSSVQLASYFAGYSAIYDLREQLKREQGEDFDLKRFHEKFLSYGSAPVAVIKELMLQK